MSIWFCIKDHPFPKKKSLLIIVIIYWRIQRILPFSFMIEVFLIIVWLGLLNIILFRLSIFTPTLIFKIIRVKCVIHYTHLFICIVSFYLFFLLYRKLAQLFFSSSLLCFSAHFTETKFENVSSILILFAAGVQIILALCIGLEKISIDMGYCRINLVSWNRRSFMLL